MNRIPRPPTFPAFPALLAVSLLAGFTPSEAAAQLHLGPQLVAATDSGAGLGARLVFPPRLGFLSLDGVIEGNYFFRSDDEIRRRFEVNANGRIPLPVSEAFAVRVGGGLNASFVTEGTVEAAPASTETELGGNLLAAVEFSRNRLLEGRAVPFVELRLSLGTYEQVVLTGGLTLGPPRR